MSTNQEETKPKHPGGRPPKFQTADELEAVYRDWRSEFNLGRSKFGEIPDVEGFCDYIDSYRDLFSEYEKKPEFSDTIKRIKNWIYYRKKQLAMTGKMNATVYIFDAKNNHGYVDKMEQDITTDGQALPVMVQFINDATTTRNTDTD